MDNLKSIVISAMRAGALPYQEKNLELELTIADKTYTIKTNLIRKTPSDGDYSELLIMDASNPPDRVLQSLVFKFIPQDNSARTEIKLPDNSIIAVVDSWQAKDGDVRSAKVEISHVVKDVVTLEWMTEADMVARTVTHIRPGAAASVYRIAGEEEKPFNLIANNGRIIATIDGTVPGEMLMDFTEINERMLFKHTGL